MPRTPAERRETAQTLAADTPFDAVVAHARAASGVTDAVRALDLVAEAHPSRIDAARRRRDGVWYTPRDVADRVAAAAGDAHATVVDPACGCGALLVAVARRERHRGRDPAALRWVGRDLDPVAVRLARARLALALAADEHDAAAVDARLSTDFTVGDGLALPTSGEPATVVANPPFGGAVRARTGRDADETARLRARWPLAARGAFDRCAPFVAWAFERVKDGGQVALVLPRTWLAAPAGTHLRAHLDAVGALAGIDDVGGAFADAAVPAVIVHGPGDGHAVRVQRWGGAAVVRPAPRDGAWGPLVSPWADTLQALAAAPRLDDRCTIAASATTGEAYAIRDAVTDGGAGYRLVTSGAIDPLSHAWGTRTQRYLGTDRLHPTIPRDAAPPRRRAGWDAPRVLVPGLAPLLEAVVVEPGVAGAVATLALVTDDGGPPLQRLAAVLNGTLTRVAYRALWAAQAMGGGSTPITRGRLGAVPVPAPLLAPASASPHPDAVAELRAHAEALAGDPLRLPTPDALAELGRVAQRSPATVAALDAVLSTAPPAVAVAAVDLVTATVAPDAWAVLVRDARTNAERAS